MKCKHEKNWEIQLRNRIDGGHIVGFCWECHEEFKIEDILNELRAILRPQVMFDPGVE
jgi:hypothetical protein